MTSEIASALAERLDEDTPFTAAFDDDPLTTLRDGGFASLRKQPSRIGNASASSSHGSIATTSSGRESSKIRWRS